MELLLAMVAARDRVLSRDELLAAVWPDVVVEEANLTQNISVLRKALGEEAGENRYIATIPGRGYRFVAEVEEEPRSATGANEADARRTELLPHRRRLGRAALIGAAVVTTLVVGLWLGVATIRRPSPPPIRPGVIAVLPIQIDGFDRPADERGIALADAVIRRLAELGADVVPTRAVLEFADPRRDTPQQAGRAVGAETVVAIAVSERDGVVEASGQLVLTVSGIASQSFRTELPGSLDAVSEALAEEIAERISAVL